MRLTLCWFGFELDISLGPTTVDDEPACSLDGGTTSSYPIGYAPTPHPSWERPLNQWDEPSEDSEDV